LPLTDAEFHRAAVPVVVTAPANFNAHTLTPQSMNNNSFGDQTDYFTAKLIY
jgi:hypothetical protein